MSATGSWNHRITERLGLEETSKPTQPQALPWAGLPPTSSGCPLPYLTWPERLQGWGTTASLRSDASDTALFTLMTLDNYLSSLTYHLWQHGSSQEQGAETASRHALSPRGNTSAQAAEAEKAIKSWGRGKVQSERHQKGNQLGEMNNTVKWVSGGQKSITAALQEGMGPESPWDGQKDQDWGVHCQEKAWFDAICWWWLTESYLKHFYLRDCWPLSEAQNGKTKAALKRDTGMAEKNPRFGRVMWSTHHLS